MTELSSSTRIFTDHPNLVRAMIPAVMKPHVMDMLSDYGIDRAFLFPDLDGLSAKINADTLRVGKPAAQPAASRPR